MKRLCALMGSGYKKSGLNAQTTPTFLLLSTLSRYCLIISRLLKDIAFKIEIIENHAKTVQTHHQSHPAGKGLTYGCTYQFTVNTDIDRAFATAGYDLRLQTVGLCRGMQASRGLPSLGKQRTP